MVKEKCIICGQWKKEQHKCPTKEELQREKERYPTKCNLCQKIYFVISQRLTKTKYCSNECKQKYHKINRPLCPTCFKNIPETDKKYCNMECFLKSTKGFTIDKDGYKKIRIETGVWMKEHHYIWIQNYGKIPEGYIIHHKNHNRLDNRIGNLELMTKEEHSKYHITRRIKRGEWKNPNKKQ